MIYVVNKRRKIKSIRKQYPSAYILDVTSSSTLSMLNCLALSFLIKEYLFLEIQEE